MNGEPFNLRAARLNRGYSQREAAAVIGVPRETLRRVENGLGVMPSNAKKIADFFGVRVTDVMPLEEVA